MSASRQSEPVPGSVRGPRLRNLGGGRRRPVLRRTALAALAIWLGAALTAPALPAAAATVGRIEGRVIDRTAPAHPLAHQRVRFMVIERGVLSERETRSDARGAFAFTGLPVGGIRVFVLSTVYRSVRYDSDRVVLSASSPVHSVDLTVYEPSPDRSVLRTPVAFAVVEIARGGLRVSVIQRFDNPTDRVVAISPRDPLIFPLPRGAGLVRFLGGWRDPRVDNGRIEDAFPIFPGTTHVAYSYVVDVRRSEVTLPWTLPYGAEDVEVLVADVGVQVAGDGLRPLGTVTGRPGRYLRWSGGPVALGGQVAVRLQGVPVGQAPWPGVVAVALALTLGIGLALGLRRSRGASE